MLALKQNMSPDYDYEQIVSGDPLNLPYTLSRLVSDLFIELSFTFARQTNDSTTNAALGA
jgi:hypothetical protein